MVSGKDRNSYHAFISYSHAVDGQLAPKLHLALGAFAKPWYRRRAIRIFRDQTSLAATPNLWPTIEVALNASGFFILLASPGAAHSHWVAKELQTFVDRAGADHVLIVLTDGELRWSEQSGDFDWTVTDAFPNLSRPIFATEPLWVDLRGIRRSDNLTLRNRDFHDAVARLSAAIREVTLDDLVGEDVRLHRQTVRLAWTMVSILMTLAAGLSVAGMYAYRKGIDALNSGVAAQEAARRAHAEFIVSSASSLEARDPLSAALVLAELDDSYRSERGLRLLRQIVNQLPVAVLPSATAVPSGDRSRILTTSGESVQVHDAHTLAAPKTFKGSGAVARDAAIDRRGRRVAIAGDDQTVTVWDVDGNQPLSVIPDYNYRYTILDRATIALSPSGEHVAFLSGIEARVARADGTRPPVVLKGHGKETLSVAFSTDGHHVVTTSLDRTTRVWSLDGRQEDVFRVDRSHPTMASFTPDGRGVLTKEDGGTARLWRRGAGGSVTFNAGEYSIYKTVLSPDGETVAAGTSEGAVVVWSADKPGEPIVVLRGHTDRVLSVDFSVDGTRLVSASSDGTVRVWRRESKESVPIKLKKGLVQFAFFSGDGRRIFADGIGTEVFNTDSGGGDAPLLHHGDEVLSLGFSPDGRRIVTTSKDGTVRVWDLKSSRPPLLLRGHTAPVRVGSFGHDGQDVMTVGNDGTARIWSLDKPESALVLRAPNVGFIEADRSLDGKRVVVSAEGVIRVWDVASPEQPRILNGPAAQSAVFSPDRTKILAISEHSAFLWNADGQGTPLELTTGGHGRVARASFSRDGSRIVGYSAASKNYNVVIVWRTDGSGSPTVLPVREALLDVAFSPDGQRVLVLTTLRAFIWPADGHGESLPLEESPKGWQRKGVFSADGSRVAVIVGKAAAIWRTDGPGAPLVLEGHSESLTDIAISPDGTHVATASSDSTARLWSIDWPSLIRHVRTRVQNLPVCLTTNERMQYLVEEDAVARARSQACSGRPNRQGAAR